MRPALATALLAATVGWSSAIADVSSGVFGRREQLLAHFQQLPIERLQAFFMACDRVSRVRLMGADEGAMCAMAWDSLLERRFSGDVDALLSWWRSEVARTQRAD